MDKLISAPQLFEKIDQDIAPFLQQPVSKLDKIVLQILRLAIFELQMLKDIPPNVVIDEYVGITASFFDHKKVTFVNAVLDKLK